MKRLVQPLIITVTISLLWTLQVQGQEISPLEFRYQYIPSTGLDHPNLNSDGDLEVSITRFSSAIAFPLYISPDRNILAFRLAYESLDLDFRHLGLDKNVLQNLDRFHSIEATLFYSKYLNAKWSLLSFLTPGIESDLKSELALADLSISAALVFIRSYGEKLKLGYGIFYSRSIGEPFPLPAFSFQWDSGGLWTAGGIIPVMMDLTIRPSDFISTGMMFRMQGNQYHGDPNTFELDNPKLKFRELIFGPYLELKPHKWLKLELDSGVVFARRLEFLDGNREVHNIDLEPTVFIRTGISIPLP